VEAEDGRRDGEKGDTRVSMNVGYVFGGLLAVLGVLVAATAVITTRLCLRLKKYHNALWQSLGRPMPGDRYRNGTRFLRFLRLRQYETLHDESTKHIAAWARAANKVLLTYIFVGSAVVFAVILVDKYRH
jgi:hypothetical protein